MRITCVGVMVIATVTGVTACGSSDHHQAATATPSSTASASATATVTPTLTCPIPAETPGDDEQFGAELSSDDVVAEAGKCPPAAALATRAGASSTPPPRATIPPTLLPPVQAQGTTTMQGSPGSCEVWSAGYAMGSYTANLVNGQPLSDLNNTVSPGFLYPWVLNEELKPCGMATEAKDTLDYLVTQTAPSLAAVPYSPSCACLDMVDINQTYATDLRIGSWCYFSEPSLADTLTAIKSYLAQGHVVQTSIVVPWAFGEYTGGVFEVAQTCPSPAPSPPPSCAAYNGITCVASTTTSSGCAQHGIALVGYDDDVTAPSGAPGAFRIMNSFGPAWGENGFMWMSYGTFASIYLAGTLAFPPAAAIASAQVIDAYQWVEQRNGEPPHAHLLFDLGLAAPLHRADIDITGPDQRTTTHHYAQPFRRGLVYLTRRDGNQFEPGRYLIEIRADDGRVLDLEATVDRDAASPIPAAPLPDDVTGTNHQAVTIH